MKKKNIFIRRVFLITLFFGILFLISTQVSRAFSGVGNLGNQEQVAPNTGSGNYQTNPPILSSQESFQSGESDAIAVRVIPNPNHLSAQKWYKSQGFSGSPQSLIVDGYQAVRDGRTVYVSATNVVGNNIYTNIYLISYDQEADHQTVDIFGKILSNWKFNTNINANVGSCVISNRSCYSDSDCSEGYVCGSLGNAQANKCILKEADEDYTSLESSPRCLLDSDCPGKLFCTSLKSRIIRDLDRLEKIILLKEKIEQYNNKNGRYPTLLSGTYLPHVAISTWPSWQSSFLGQIGASGVVDPINSLGSCADENKKFDLNTCWREEGNYFFTPNNNYNNFTLPPYSYVIAYTSNPNGTNYNLCAVMETVLGGDNYTISGGPLSDLACSLGSGVGNTGFVGHNTNQAPYVSEYMLEGEAGQEFNGYIKAIDPEGHSITWGGPGIVTSLGAVNNFNHWIPSTIPQFTNTNNPLQKRLWAEKAGSPGVYKIRVNLADNVGSSSSEVLNIVINPSNPQIIAGDVNYVLGSGSIQGEMLIKSKTPLSNGNVKIFRSNNESNKVSLNIIESGSPFFYIPPFLPPLEGGLQASLTKLSDQDYSLKIFGTLNHNVFPAGSYPYTIEVTTPYGSSTKQFSINVAAENLVLDLSNCPTIAPLGSYYVCPVSVFGSNDGVNFSVESSLPRGLSYNSSEKKIKGYILDSLDQYPINVSAHNNFGANTSKTFTLSTFSDCENSLVKHEGGPWNSSGSTRNNGGYYKTVLIGGQCWLKENLNIGTMLMLGSEPHNNTTIEKHCFDDNEIYCQKLGGVYQWDEAMDYFHNNTLQGICPNGWRVPTDNDWYVLENYLKDPGQGCNANRVMGSEECYSTGFKITKNQKCCANNDDNNCTNWPGNNSSGFSAVCAPSMSSAWWGFDNLNTEWTGWLTSSLYDNDNVLTRHVFHNNGLIQRQKKPRNSGFYAVRCVKDVKECHNNSDCAYLGGGYTCNSYNLCSSNVISGGTVSPVIVPGTIPTGSDDNNIPGTITPPNASTELEATTDTPIVTPTGSDDNNTPGTITPPNVSTELGTTINKPTGSGDNVSPDDSTIAPPNIHTGAVGIIEGGTTNSGSGSNTSPGLNTGTFTGGITGKP